MNKKICIVCGGSTKFDFQDLCDNCLALPIEEIEERYLKRKTPGVRLDQEQMRATGNTYEPKSLYRRSKEFVKGILFSRS